jgi:hypothetical protein
LEGKWVTSLFRQNSTISSNLHYHVKKTSTTSESSIDELMYSLVTILNKGSTVIFYLFSSELLTSLNFPFICVLSFVLFCLLGLPLASLIQIIAYSKWPRPQLNRIREDFLYLHIKTLYSMWQNLELYFLLMFSRIKLTVVLLWILLVFKYPLRKLEKFPPLRSVMSQDLALQQDSSRLQTTSANLWTFSINVTSPFRIHFPLLNPTELRHYRVTCIILLTRIKN